LECLLCLCDKFQTSQLGFYLSRVAPYVDLNLKGLGVRVLYDKVFEDKLPDLYFTKIDRAFAHNLRLYYFSFKFVDDGA